MVLLSTLSKITHTRAWTNLPFQFQVICIETFSPILFQVIDSNSECIFLALRGICDINDSLLPILKDSRLDLHNTLQSLLPTWVVPQVRLASEFLQ